MNTIAIIMRSKNEMPHTPKSLEALDQQTRQDITLYNVDSGSTDGTLECVLERNPTRTVQIRPEEYIPGRVLNMMIQRTTEPIVVFLNADAIPTDPQWLEHLIAPILRDEADATMSRQIPREEASFIVKYDYQRAFNPRNIKGSNRTFFSAVACAFRRDLWEEHRFREQGYSEDLDWSKRCQAAGARFQLVVDSVVEHSHNYTLRQWYRKEFIHGEAYTHIFDRQPKISPILMACAREMARDTLYATRRLKLLTVPHNLLWRITFYTAQYQGLKVASGRAPLTNTILTTLWRTPK